MPSRPFGLPAQDPDLCDPSLPEHLLPVGLAEWFDLIFRADMRGQRKSVALHIGLHVMFGAGGLDGTDVPARAPQVALMSGVREARAAEHVEALVGMGLLHLKVAAGAESVYRLTCPADLSELPLWLDENMDRVPGYERGGRR